jgi:transcriptional regulator
MLVDNEEKRRLYLNIDVKGEDECWLWKGYVAVYGKSKTAKWSPPTWSDLSTQAVRAVWELEFGKIQEGVKIRHTCKNSLCCNVKHLKLNIDAESKFWDNVEKTSSCWIWTGAKTGAGYGSLRVSVQRPNVLAHRYSMELTHGFEIPRNVVCCHKCDRPDCVSPHHIFLGTQSDNLTDMAFKGRANSGEKNKDSRLSDDDVIQIKEMLAANITQVVIAKRFNVTQAQVSRINKGIAWKHLQLPDDQDLEESQIEVIILLLEAGISERKIAAACGTTRKMIQRVKYKQIQPRPKKERNGAGKDFITDEQKEDIKRLAGNGTSQSKLAKQFNISQSRISQIVRGV